MQKRQDKKHPIEYYKRLYGLKEWQALHVNQLTSTRKLYITLNSILFGLALTYIDDIEDGVVASSMIVLSFVSSMLSFYHGIRLAYSESENFRKKYKISRILDREEGWNEEAKILEKECTDHEDENKYHLKYQGYFFLMAVIAFGLSVYASNKEKFESILQLISKGLS